MILETYREVELTDYDDNTFLELLISDFIEIADTQITETNNEIKSGITHMESSRGELGGDIEGIRNSKLEFLIDTKKRLESLKEIQTNGSLSAKDLIILKKMVNFLISKHKDTPLEDKYQKIQRRILDIENSYIEEEKKIV